MKNNELARTFEVVAAMSAKLAREGVAENQIAFMVREGLFSGSAAAEAYIRSGVGKVPVFEIMDHLENSDASFALQRADATPKTDAAPDLSNMSPIQKLAYARSLTKK